VHLTRNELSLLHRILFKEGEHPDHCVVIK
jgi:hypothetical protein